MSDIKNDYAPISETLAQITKADLERRAKNKQKRQSSRVSEGTFDTGLKGYAIKVVRPRESGFEMTGKGAADAMIYSRPRRPENIREQDD